VVLGEAPGRQEAEAGRPFVGPAGEVIRTQLTRIGIDPESVTWVNTVSCFPDGTPKAHHIKACVGNRDAQLDLISPEIILVLGRTALRALVPQLELKWARARPFKWEGAVCFGAYHPAAILRDSRRLEDFETDLDAFGEMVKTLDRWWEMIPDNCALCPIDAAWMDDRGLGWCEFHLPTEERQRFEARQSFLEKDLAAARERLAS
jgi:DNA polymerase